MSDGGYGLTYESDSRAIYYTPKKCYHVTQPVPLSSFLDRSVLAMTVPINKSWLINESPHPNNPGFMNTNIFVTNLSGQPQIITYNLTPKPANTQVPNELETTTALGKFSLGHGETLNLTTIPYLFHLSFVGPADPGDLHSVKYNTFDGVDMADLKGRQILIVYDSDTNEYVIREGKSDNVARKFCVITNTTTDTIFALIHKFNSSMSTDSQEKKVIKDLRSYDDGPSVQPEKVEIPAGSSWHVAPQGTRYTVRVVEPESRLTTTSHAALITEIPPVDNYVEEKSVNNVRSGDFVVITGKPNCDIECISIFPPKDIKLVNSLIVTNKLKNVGA